MNKKYLNPLSYVRPLGSRGYLNWMPDELYLKLCYRAAFHKKLDLKNPKTYNEKLQWMKLYDRNPLYCTLVDKYAVRSYIAENLGEEYLIPMVGGPWTDPEEIDFEALPERFVLKCNHGSTTNIICKDKSSLDIPQAKAKLKKWLGTSWFWYGREWPYKDLKPCIYAEAYMEDEQDRELRDYKFFCFAGKPHYMLLSTDRSDDAKQTRGDFFDMEYNHMPFRKKHLNAEVMPAKPRNFQAMQELAVKMSKDLPAVRIDLYDVNGRIYFGEYTFFSGSGFGPFHPAQWDEKLGSLIPLP